jgi:uncharacterized protein (DUF362 family)
MERSGEARHGGNWMPEASVAADQLASSVNRTMEMQVGVIEVPADEIYYPERAPFHPDTQYPELPFAADPGSSNPAYLGVREVLRVLGYDRERFGTPAWNPLGWLIHPGETVFLKPNMIAHKHTENDDWQYVITHGSVLRAVVDYVYIALEGRGRIVIGDAPQTDSKFDEIIAEMGLPEIKSFYKRDKNFVVDIVDLRHEHWIDKDGIYVDTVTLPGDPQGTMAVDLGGDSLFAELDGHAKRYYGAYYDVEETNSHHRGGKHEYCISRSPIAADAFISVPKLKTHKKCGLTVNLKGLVGINGNKNWLPHYIFGAPETGGDQFPRVSNRGLVENWLVVNAKRLLLERNRPAQFLARKFKKLAYRLFGANEQIVRSGNWHGNDTVWRMSVDLNRILLYANPDCTMRPAGEAKRYFSIVDGLYAMEGNGPVSGKLRKAGMMVGGTNPVAVDATCAAIMGFDYRKLLLIARAFEDHRYPLAIGQHQAIECISNVERWEGNPSAWRKRDLLNFRPHFAWQGHIEMNG